MKYFLFLVNIRAYITEKEALYLSVVAKCQQNPANIWKNSHLVDECPSNEYQFFRLMKILNKNLIFQLLPVSRF